MDRLVRTLLDRFSSSPDSDGETLGPAEEAALVVRAQGGDRAAFGLLARSHYRRLYVTARHLVGNHEDAEDLSQEAFVKAHQSLDWYRGEGAFGGWLRRILVHLTTDRFRREARAPEPQALEGLPDPADARGPVAEAGARELEGIVERAIQSLPARLRIPLVLRTLEGLDYDDVASATGVTSATARTQVMQARRALSRLLGKHLQPEHRPEDDGREPRS